MTGTELQQEVYRLNGIIRSQVDSLNHWRKAFDTTQLEARVRSWVEERIGKDHMAPRERAMRLLEEAIELCQAEGIQADLVAKQCEHVYARPAGDPKQEAGGVAVCLYGWCASRGVRLTEIAKREIERIECKPIEQIRGSLARKFDSDLVTVVERQHQPFEYDTEAQ